MIGSAVFKKMRVDDGNGNAAADGGKAGKAPGQSQAKPKSSAIDKKMLAKDLQKQVEKVIIEEGHGELSPSGAPEDDGERPLKKMRVDGASKGQSSTSSKSHMHQKLQHKKNQFSGFSEEEIKSYQSFVHPLEIGKFVERPKTALDEMIYALQWVCDRINEAEGDKLNAAGRVELERASKEASTPMTFCLSLFLQFAYTGEVSANGRMFKAYSALRTELQSLMFQAQDLCQQFIATTDDRACENHG